MKKFKLILLLLVCSFVLTACTGTITRNLRKSGYSVGDKDFKCELLTPSKNKQEGKDFERIKFLTNSYAISTTGNVYELSLGGLFSNNMNCRKATRVQAVAIMDNSVIRDKDGKYYYLKQEGNGTLPYQEVTRDDKNYQLYDMLLRDTDVIKISTVNANAYNYYVLKTDGNIYNYIFEEVGERDKILKFRSSSIIYAKSRFGNSPIIDFNYYGDSTATYFRTEKEIYRYAITNADQCNKYVDIPCQYELKIDEKLTEYQEHFLGYGGSIILTDYKRIFTLGS